MNQTELADEFGVDRRTIATWDKEGLKEYARTSDRPVTYDPVRAWRWRWEHKRPRITTEKEAKVRKLEAEAAKKELELAERAGLLVLISDVRRTWSTVLGRLRSKLVAYEGALAPRLAGLESPREVKAVLSPAIQELLDELRATADEIGADGAT